MTPTRGRVGVVPPTMTTSLIGTGPATWQLRTNSCLTAMVADGADRHVGGVLG